MNKPPIRTIALGLVILIWLSTLTLHEDIRLIPCDAFADDVGYMDTSCSVQNFIEDIGDDNIRLTLPGFVMAFFLFLGMPGLAIWSIRQK